MPPFSEVLKPSPHFALEFNFTGGPYLWSLSYPYEQMVEINDEYRILLNCFAGKGTRVSDALRVFNKIQSPKIGKRSLKRGYALVASLKSIGALVVNDNVPSMYDISMAKHYAEHRMIPPRVIEWVVRAGKIKKNTQVLDMACGTGALTNQLAKVSNNVTGIDVSSSFLDQAHKDAKESKLQVRYILGSCNRLALHNENYDVVVISCAAHWLDPFQWARGVHRVLRDKGRVLILTGDLFLPEGHPLSFLKDTRSDKPSISYLNYLFRAAWMIDGIKFVPEFNFVEKRKIGVDYMRGYLSQEHLKLLKVPGWKNPEKFWLRMERKIRSSSAQDLKGFFYWHGLKLELKTKKSGIVPE